MVPIVVGALGVKKVSWCMACEARNYHHDGIGAENSLARNSMIMTMTVPMMMMMMMMRTRKRTRTRTRARTRMIITKIGRPGPSCSKHG